MRTFYRIVIVVLTTILSMILGCAIGASGVLVINKEINDKFEESRRNRRYGGYARHRYDDI